VRDGHLVGGTAEETALHFAYTSSIGARFAEQEHPENAHGGHDDGKCYEVRYAEVHPCGGRSWV
jgi:hypothetical protein